MADLVKGLGGEVDSKTDDDIRVGFEPSEQGVVN